METLTFKVDAELIVGEIYSVCLRGARKIRVDHSGRFYLWIDTPSKKQTPASVVNQRQYSFNDLIYPHDYKDNYNPKARTYEGLNKAMLEVYPDFDPREIVTIVRFKVEKKPEPVNWPIDWPVGGL